VNPNVGLSENFTQENQRMKNGLVVAMTLLGMLYVSGVHAANFQTVNVVTAGMVCDGATDDSAKFQAILNANGNDTLYYFPSKMCAIRNITLTNARNLTFYGDSRETSGLRYKEPTSSYLFMMTCTGCVNITFHDIGIDNKHIANYGGMRFYAASDVALQRVKVYDSQERPSSSTDRYGFVFAGGSMHSDILVEDSEFHGLQLEISTSQRVTVQNNTFYNANSTTAVGSFSLKDGAQFFNHLYQNNVIINPKRCGICLNLDPPSTNNTQWRHIKIINNVIQRRVDNYNIRLGTNNSSVLVTGTVFDDIYADGNRVYAVGFTPTYPVVKLNGRSSYGITFTNTTVTPNNVIFE
jgi:hypothetical protein